MAALTFALINAVSTYSYFKKAIKEDAVMIENIKQQLMYHHNKIVVLNHSSIKGNGVSKRIGK